jgi:hypothetical protein
MTSLVSCQVIMNFKKINLGQTPTIHENVLDWKGLKNVHHKLQQNINQKSNTLSPRKHYTLLCGLKFSS